MSVVAVKFDLIDRSADSYAEAFAAWLHAQTEAPDAALLIMLASDGTVRMRVEASAPFNNLELLGLLDRARHMTLVNVCGDVTEVPGPYPAA